MARQSGNNSSQASSTESAEAATAAIKEIKRYYRIGRESFDSNERTFGLVDKLAKKDGLTAVKWRQARRFAKIYTSGQVAALCDLIEKNNSVITVSFVFRLMTIPKDDRTGFELKAIEGGWSVRELNTEIRKGFGNRRPPGGGRKHPRPQTRVDAFYDLARVAQTWQGLYRALEVQQNGNPSHLSTFPEGVKSQVNEVGSKIRALKKSLRRVITRGGDF